MGLAVNDTIGLKIDNKKLFVALIKLCALCKYHRHKINSLSTQSNNKITPTRVKVHTLFGHTLCL